MTETQRLLVRLEESLWRPGTRFDRAHLEAVLAPGFVEFGRSGRVYDREMVMAQDPFEFQATLPLPDLALWMITPDVALLTYRSEISSAEGAVRANRCSVWRRASDSWQLEFHQGTPISPAG